MLTNNLRKLIRSAIITATQQYGIKDVYYRIADDDAMFPHIVFSFDSYFQNVDDLNRYDYSLYIDVYDKGKETRFAIEDLTFTLTKEFNALNCPTNEVLPTIYFENANELVDEDKDINHNQIQFVVQTYERN